MQKTYCRGNVVASSAISTIAQSQYCIHSNNGQARQGSPIHDGRRESNRHMRFRIREDNQQEGVWFAACSLQEKNIEYIIELVNACVIDVVKYNAFMIHECIIQGETRQSWLRFRCREAQQA